ncbi:MAG: restriction endonuclease [Cyclobacteriaceae bacterium]|nr:restriction endonuclease [Cyclobacteriaceae bacterium]
MPRTIQVFEHEQLTLRPDRWGRKLEPEELEKLYAFNDRKDNVYFTGIRHGIKFKSYVGVIQIGGLTLEILPKADKQKEGTESEHSAVTAQWRNALLRMLAICRHIDLESVSEANLERRHHSILDLYFEIFLQEVDKLLHQGLSKKYRHAQGNVTALKGRLDFGRNISQNLIHQERFYTHHQVYDQDHLINQILLRALIILDQIATSPFIKDRLARVMLDFPEIKEMSIQAHHFERLSENRKTIHYQKAIQIAKMIILNYSPDIRGGHEDMLALLFDMNKLWEEYVYRVLQHEAPDNTSVSFQNSKLFWQSEQVKKNIRPDLVITRTVGGEKETYIVDTKWKVLDDLRPDDGDLKQIFAYNLYWESYHSILLYPSTQTRTLPVRGMYEKGMSKDHGCMLAFVEVLDKDGKLNGGCAEQVWSWMTEVNTVRSL